jgi:hypothetical protein
VRGSRFTSAAAIWSLLYGALGVYWATGGRGFPFGVGNDPAASQSILGRATAADTAPFIAVVGIFGAIVALVVTYLPLRGTIRAAALVVAWLHAVTLALLIPDFRPLALIAYAPILLIGLAFGWSPAGASEAFNWPLANQFLCLTGGLLWGAVAMTMHVGGSRPGGPGNARATRWTQPESAARWGKWAVGVAIVVPCLYAVTRLAWAFGIPLGIDERLVNGGAAGSGGTVAGAAFALAVVALCGAILTLGLIRRWGEVFPRWLPIIGGTRVPLPLVIVPAGLMSVLITGAGLTFIRLTLTGVFRLDANWAVSAPMLVWPVWGSALAAATVAYYYRTRAT